VGNDGRAELRFGDDEYGRDVDGATAIRATYRVGNGRAGNVGAESIFHIVRPTIAGTWPLIDAVRNPIASRDGVDPETIEEVRQYAPAAFRAEQFRAVTEQDYVDALRRMSEVAGAVASFRWTGSWYTVYVGIDPRNPNDLITLAGGRTQLTPEFELRVRAFLTRYKLAGYDLEIRTGQYAPVDLALDVCVCRNHFRADVAQAVRRALSNRRNADGTLGFFHPDRFTFGQDVHLSRLYAAVEVVPGVDSVVITTFQRFGKSANGELEAGVLPIGPWEIARLDNDPNFLERGALRVAALGGK
jgi:predicted phage baseplate assembly protein